MSFQSPFTNDIPPSGAGERYGPNQVILSTDNFEDGLVIGRFAKLDSGRIDNMDGSATPTFAGLVLRHSARAVEDEGVIDKTLYQQAEYMREGLATVEVVSGESPTMFGTVYASNSGDTDDGAALATQGENGIDTGAEFIREVTTGVWLIRLK